MKASGLQFLPVARNSEKRLQSSLSLMPTTDVNVASVINMGRSTRAMAILDSGQILYL